MAKKTDEFDVGSFDAGEDPFAGEEDQNKWYSSQENSQQPQSGVEGGAPSAPPMGGATRAPSIDKKVVNLTSDIPVQVVAVLGKKNVTVKDIVSMKMGQVLELNRLPNEAIDLVANGKLIAKGELVEIEGRLGVRVLKIFD